MSPKSTALPGKYNASVTPWVAGIHEALDDPSIFKVVAMKSAQVAWTDGVLLNYVGRRIDIDPCPMIIMFAKEGAAKKFNEEKFVPMVEVTPRLGLKIPVRNKRDKDNKWDFKGFPGGFLKLVSSNSPSDVKSTPAPVVCVEEPDDCNDNVKNQGNTIRLLEERTKTFSRRKVIFGGTPTVAGLSAVEAAFKEGDQRKFYVPCPDCGNLQTLEWENVHWNNNDLINHEIYGHADLESVRYVCPHCGSLWDNAKKNRAVKLGKWQATSAFNGTASFTINEIYSPFPGSTLKNIVAKYLRAKQKMDEGDDSDMRSFINNQLGRAYEFQSGLPEIEDLRSRSEDYEEFTVPELGCVLTAGVDVQHDRLAVVIVAWGPGEESWRIYWGEIYGPVMIPEKGAWADLETLLSRSFSNGHGSKLTIRAVSIDSSDGQTQDAVYAFVRRRVSRGFMAIKGSSINDESKEIFSIPKPSIDMGFKNKASKFGLRPYIVGTSRAKDLILGVDAGAGRLKLLGSGPGRMHWYKTIRPDYFEQLTSEVKAPSARSRKRVWQKKSGFRNEALDCEVYALHAARSLRLHLWSKERWDEEKQKQVQLDLMSSMPSQKNEPPVQTVKKEEPIQTKEKNSFFNVIERMERDEW